MAKELVTEYQHALNLRNKFEIKTMKDYHDLYLQCNVLLSGDAFEKFRIRRLENCGLSPSHYLNTPALSWDKRSSISKVEIDLISDVDMYLLFEKGMRDGVSHSSRRCSQANNKHLTLHDPKKQQNILHTWKKKFIQLCYVKISSNGQILVVGFCEM